MLNEISQNRISKIIGFILLIAVIVFLSYLFFDIIVMLAISLLIAILFSPVVAFLERRGFSRLMSVLTVFFGSTALMVLGLATIIPKIVAQMNTLAGSLSKDKVVLLVSQLQELIGKSVPFLDGVDLPTQIGNFISNTFYTSINNISQIVSSIVSIIAISVIVPFMTFFLLKDDTKIIKGLLSVLPNKYFEMSYYILKQIILQLTRFVRGWILDAVFVGVLSIVGLSILGIDNSVSIGLIAGIGHLIPYFGPVIGGLPAIILSVVQFGNFSMFPSIALLFVTIYSIDNGFVQPNILSKATDIHPLFIIILILVGSQLLGVTGMLLAVPTATIVKTAAKEIYLGYKNYKIIKQ